MSTHVTIGDQQVKLGDFSGFKFLEAVALIGEIMEAVPLADEKISEYAQSWTAQNGAERILDRTSARYLLGEAIDPITEAEWQASEQKLRLAKSPDGNAAMMRAFPAVYKHARRQVENLVCLIATPNSLLEDADEKGEAGSIYESGGVVHGQRKLILHRARITEQVQIVLGSMQQLAEELQEADLGGQMRDFRRAVAALNRAINPAASNDETGTPDDEPNDESEATEPPVPASEPSSSTAS